MRKYLFWAVVCLLSMSCRDISLCAEEALKPEKLYAQSAVLMDADSGRILFEKNGNERKANASTTKILTCILALEEGDRNRPVTVSKKAAAQPAVHLGMREGQQFYLSDLLYSLMLESHNDTAVAIAEHVSGSVEAFADRMNEKAREIGCENTHFVSPNGLDWEDEEGVHETTAKELALIMRYCIGESEKKEEFLKITGTSSWNFSDCEGKGNYHCVNHNAFLSMMEGAISGKTGFTNKAGYCYTGALEDEGRTFIVTLLACGWPNNKTYKWSDARKMMEYALEHYRYEELYGTFSFEPVIVENGIRDSQKIGEEVFVKLKSPSVGDTSMLLSDADQVKIQVTLPEKLTAPVNENRVVGRICYYLNGEEIRSYPVMTAERIDKKDYVWCFQKILNIFLRQK